MPTLTQILSKLEVQKNADETFSQSGLKEVSEHNTGEVMSVVTRRTSPKPRSKQSINNSYT